MFNAATVSFEYITMIIIWAAITIFAIVIEFETANFVSIWFAAGSLAGLATAAFNKPIWLQIVLFICISFVCILLTRPFIKKMSDNQTIHTNADRLEGMKAVVTKDIVPGEKGEVKIDFNKWPAVTNENRTFKEGESVIVVEIVGNKLVVKAMEEIEIN